MVFSKDEIFFSTVYHVQEIPFRFNCMKYHETEYWSQTESFQFMLWYKEGERLEYFIKSKGPTVTGKPCSYTDFFFLFKIFSRRGKSVVDRINMIQNRCPELLLQNFSDQKFIHWSGNSQGACYHKTSHKNLIWVTK